MKIEIEDIDSCTKNLKICKGDIRDYSVLENLSKQLLPGTKLSISKTVETLVMERNLKAEDKSSKTKKPMTKEKALEIIGGDLGLWGISGDDPRCGPPQLEAKKGK